jgi:uracil-DNA glycosylase family 4
MMAWQHTNPADGCLKCPALVKSRQNVVWSKGQTDAPIMVIAEAPGQTEDIKQQPFVGRSGAELDRLFLAAGLDPKLFHYANTIMCRPPDNRDPNPDELLNCAPWLTEHIKLINPKAIIHFGAYSIASAFDRHLVGEARGLYWRKSCDNCGSLETRHAHRRSFKGEWVPDSFGVCKRNEMVRRRLHLATYHPAAIFRNPQYRDMIISDLIRFEKEFTHEFGKVK